MPKPIVFVVGAPRSGTTLLRVMLAGHPQLFSPPEMVIAPFATMADRKRVLGERWWEKGGLRRAILEIAHPHRNEQFSAEEVDAAKAVEASLEGSTVPEVYAWLREHIGERLLVDKCPHLAAEPAALERLARWYPDARWVWIVRHPGSVSRSLENMPMAEVMTRGYAGDPRDIWAICNRNIKAFLAGVPDERKALVKYEDLVGEGARTALEGACRAMGVPFDEALLTPYEGDRMREGPPGARAVGDPNLAGRGKIQPELATKWLDGFDPSSVGPDTHALARELGYDLGALAPPPITRVSAGITELLETVQRLERGIRVPADVDQVEGRRFLLRQLAHSLDLFVENGDADRPLLRHAEGPTRKQFADNPDTDYHRTPIRMDDGREYRLWGRVPAGTTYTGMLVYRRGGQIGNRLRDTQFVRPDGTFDVHVSVADPGDSVTWLRADGDETALIVRQYFTDRSKEAPIEVHVERVGGPAIGDGALAPEPLAKGIERARRNLEATFERTLATWKMASVGALNRFLPIGGEALFPTPDNSYLACWYRLGPDQVLRVRGSVPKARYTGFALYDLWMESLDYERASVALNHGSLVCEPDGTYEIVVGPSDFGAPNFLDTSGHLAGYVLIRALLPEGEVPVPQADVMYAREYAPPKR